jgi:recombinational DNA repair protein (RecF pathway)
MPTEAIQALMLNTSPYSETTLLVRLLTRERGVVRAMAKGARRARGGTPAAFELFTWIEAGLAARGGDALAVLTAAEVREGWPWLRHDMTRLAYASLALEVVTALAASSPADSFFFDDAVRYLTLLEDAAGPGSLAALFLLRLLHHAGFPLRVQPELAQLHARGELPRRVVYHFERAELAIPQARDSNYAQKLEAEIVQPFLGSAEAPERNFLLTMPALDAALGLTARTGPAALRWLIRIWEDHLQTRFAAADFLEKMVLGAKGR